MAAVFAAVWEDPDPKWHNNTVGKMEGERNWHILILDLELLDPVFPEAVVPLESAVIGTNKFLLLIEPVCDWSSVNNPES